MLQNSGHVKTLGLESDMRDSVLNQGHLTFIWAYEWHPIYTIFKLSSLHMLTTCFCIQQQQPSSLSFFVNETRAKQCPYWQTSMGKWWGFEKVGDLHGCVTFRTLQKYCTNQPRNWKENKAIKFPNNTNQNVPSNQSMDLIIFFPKLNDLFVEHHGKTYIYNESLGTMQRQNVCQMRYICIQCCNIKTIFWCKLFCGFVIFYAKEYDHEMQVFTITNTWLPLYGIP